MKKYVTILTLLLTTALFNMVSADEYWEICDSCSLVKMKSTAKSAVPSNSFDLHSVYVMDIDNENIQKFRVTSIYDWEMGRYFIDLKTQQVEQSILDEFDVILSSKHTLEEIMKTIVVPPDVIDSAWDLYSDVQAQDRFLDYVYTQANSLGALTTFTPWANLSNLLVGWSKLTITIMVKLENGAKIALKFKYVSTEGGIYGIDFVNSRDENNNPVVMNVIGNEAGLIFTNGSQSLYDFLLAFERYKLTHGSILSNCTIEGKKITCRPAIPTSN